MDLDVVARLAGRAAKKVELDDLIKAARREATPGQVSPLKDIEQRNRFRLAIVTKEGLADFEGRVAEALRVLEASLSLKNNRRQAAGYTRRSLRDNGPVEALRKVIAKRDSTGLRTLAEYGRLDCSFEQIALDFPEHFNPETLAIARETLRREHGAISDSNPA